MDKYEEALERAKELHEAGNALTKSQMEIVFPELKDSEDERVRTRLIALVEAFGQGKYKNEMLSYLEKQKAKEKYDRMAPIYDNQESFEEALDKAWKFYNDSGASTVDGCENNHIELAFAKGFREGFLAGEHKKQPAEWSKEDEKMLAKCAGYMTKLTPIPDNETFVHFEAIKDEECINWLNNRLKSLRPLPLWKPSKKQMWALEWNINNTPTGAWQRKELESLYKELKKL